MVDMKLVVIAGFLGSGKTTVLLELAKVLHTQTGGKIAIVENEVGTVGIDDHMIRDSKLPVREIYSGCICCSLRLGLIETLLDLEREQDPAVVLLEPSGVASPRQVLTALQGYGGEIDQVFVATLIDASRFIRLQSLDIPIINDGIRVADMLVLNKVDLVSEPQLTALEERLWQAREDVPIHRVCALQPKTLLPVQMAISQSAEQSRETVVEEEDNGDPEMTPSVSAKNFDLAFSEALPAAEVKEQMLVLLVRVADSLQEADCQLIGHVKAIVRPVNGGYWFGSITDFETPAQGKGKIPRHLTAAKVILNVIVYGLDSDALGAILDTAIQKHTWVAQNQII